MFLELPDVLNADELARLRVLAQQLPFIDGRATNLGSTVKQNLQIDQNDPAVAEPGEIVRNAIFRNPMVREFAYPQVLARPTLSRYEPGMHYGRHVDAPLFPSKPNPMRSDVSCTVFISDPSEYEGGDLAIDLGSRIVKIKLNPGAAVFYPSTTVHEVQPVTSGVRLVAVAWIQSHIRDVEKRDLLFRLARLAARSGEALDVEARLDLEAVRTNLYRRWTDS